jgi:hypothetical protein
LLDKLMEVLERSKKGSKKRKGTKKGKRY